MIVFIELRNFYLSCLTSGRPEPGQPVAVVRDGILVDVNPAAVEFAIVPRMTRQQATRECPLIEIIDFSPNRCHDLYDRIWRRISKMTPYVEPTDYHQGYLNLNGQQLEDNIEGRMSDLGHELQFGYRMNLQWGAGQDKWMARVVCGENRLVTEEDEESYLGKTPPDRLGLERDICKRLHRYGIHTIGDLLRVPKTFFATHLQLADTDITALLRRGDKYVRADFPPAEMKFSTDIHWGTDSEISESLRSLADDSIASLLSIKMRSHELRIVLELGENRREMVVTFDKPISDSGRLLDCLQRATAKADQLKLRSICVVLRKLVPVTASQIGLWSRPGNAEAKSLDEIRTQLHARYGSKVLQSGGEYDRSHPRRFAQLICELRGWNCP